MIDVAKLIDHWEDRSMRDEDTPQSHTAKALRLLAAEVRAWREWVRPGSGDTDDHLEAATAATDDALTLPEPRS